MPSGDPLTKKVAQGFARQGKGYKLLDAAGAVLDGPWVDTSTINLPSVEIFGTFVGTVQLRGSNSDLIPASNYEGSQIGSNITGPALVAVGMNVRWIKAIVTAWTSGSISAFLHGVS